MIKLCTVQITFYFYIIINLQYDVFNIVIILLCNVHGKILIKEF